MPRPLRLALLRSFLYAWVGVTAIMLLRPMLLGYPYTIWNVLLAPVVGLLVSVVGAMLMRASVLYTSRYVTLNRRGVVITKRLIKPEKIRSIRVRILGPTGLVVDIRYLSKGKKKRCICYGKPTTDLDRLVPIAAWLDDAASGG